MRLLVLSDSHGFTGRLGTILMKAEAEGPLDAILHLGDGYHDLAEFAGELPPVYQVAGNCDLFHQDTLGVYDFSGARIVITHGHLQHVKSGTDQLLSLALQQGAAAVLYGHTNIPDCRKEGALWVLNPGSSGSWGGSAGIIEVEDGKILSCRHYRYGDQEELT